MIRALVFAAELAASLVPDIVPTEQTAAAEPAKAGTNVTVGLETAYPGYFGLWASAWPTSMLSLEAVGTLSAVRFGATTHFPLRHSQHGRLSLVAGADVGFAHNLVRTAGEQAHGALGSLYGGVGWLGPIDLRVTAGPSLSSPGFGWVGALKIGIPVG